jgi:hypothetical protein
MEIGTEGVLVRVQPCLFTRLFDLCIGGAFLQWMMPVILVDCIVQRLCLITCRSERQLFYYVQIYFYHWTSKSHVPLDHYVTFI